MKGEQNAGQRADKGRTNCENRATKKKDKEVKKERTVVSNDDVPAMAGEFDELEAAMRKVVIADANESIRSADQTYAPFYIPTDAELLAFVEDQELSDDAVAVFMFARSTDAWQIRKSDGRVEGVRDWRKFLTAFCEKYERDRENLT
ncbi:MAG TPA: hypothetical protein VMF08_20275 [Candidatus Sulfotelmatobacter sp.]|nr:hypothetical protein [Candidatus Sulfotelmatobacter sp.]